MVPEYSLATYLPNGNRFDGRKLLAFASQIFRSVLSHAISISPFPMIFSTFYSLLSFAAAVACPFQANVWISEKISASSAADQLATVWNEISKSKKSSTWPSFAVPRLLLEDMKPSMEFVSDVMPTGRIKLVHSLGVVAKAKFEPNGRFQYTGLFEKADSMLIRLSLATDPGKGKNAIVPGASFKLFRDAAESANFVAMWGLNAQESYNFFANDFSNHVSIKGAPGILVNKFGTASTWASHIGISNLANKGQDGKLVESPKTPFQLIFRPMPGVATSETNEGIDVFDQIIASIPSGKQLYSVWAAETPGNQFFQIGVITTKSEFVRSVYGDQTLFFKHQRFEEDLEANKGWLDSCPDLNRCETCHATNTCVFN